MWQLILSKRCNCFLTGGFFNLYAVCSSVYRVRFEYRVLESKWIPSPSALFSSEAKILMLLLLFSHRHSKKQERSPKTLTRQSFHLLWTLHSKMHPGTILFCLAIFETCPTGSIQGFVCGWRVTSWAWFLRRDVFSSTTLKKETLEQLNKARRRNPRTYRYVSDGRSWVKEASMRRNLSCNKCRICLYI